MEVTGDASPFGVGCVYCFDKQMLSFSLRVAELSGHPPCQRHLNGGHNEEYSECDWGEREPDSSTRIGNGVEREVALVEELGATRCPDWCVHLE